MIFVKILKGKIFFSTKPKSMKHEKLAQTVLFHTNSSAIYFYRFEVDYLIIIFIFQLFLSSKITISVYT